MTIAHRFSSLRLARLALFCGLVAGSPLTYADTWVTLHLDTGTDGMPFAGLRYDMGNQSSALLHLGSRFNDERFDLRLESAFRLSFDSGRAHGKNLWDISMLVGRYAQQPEIGFASYFGREWQLNPGLSVEGRAGLRVMYQQEMMGLIVPEVRLALGYAL